MQLFEDLAAINRSEKFLAGIQRHDRVVNSRNRRRGIEARRGDGTLGEIVPGANSIVDPGYQVARGEIATVEIGVEVKILAKAMIKQIDRVISDLRNQAAQFKRGSGNPICIGIVGINHAEYYVGWEGEREYRTTGHGGYVHPIQEALEAERRLEQARLAFDEFLVLRFRGSNDPPYPFEWVNEEGTRLDYGAILARVSKEYDRRF